MYESSVSENDNSLDKIFVKYNIGRPSDFHGHSLSTSDIIVTIKDGERKSGLSRNAFLVRMIKQQTIYPVDTLSKTNEMLAALLAQPPLLFGAS